MTFKRRMTTAVGTALLCVAGLAQLTPPAAADSIRDRQWALSAFDADAIEKVSTGREVTVAVIDSGVDGTHPDLVGKVLPGKDFLEGGRADREGDSSHGTGMASLIAGHGHGQGGTAGIKGLAPVAKILPLRAITDSDLQMGTAKPVSQAIRYAVDHGASVINLSLGDNFKNPDMAAAVRYARQKDAVIVAAAGNDGVATPEYPASFPGVISVGAVDSSGKIWEKSNYGSNTLLSAPGVDNYSAGLNHQYQHGTGTSSATAYVSAAAALLRSKFPDLTAGQIANRLVKTAKLPDSVKGTKLPDKHYGYGFIRPYSALTEDIPEGSKNGPLPAPSQASAASAAPTAPADGSDASSSQDRSAYVIWGVVGVAVLGLVTVLAVVIVKRRRPVVPPPAPFGQQSPGPDFRS
ncbi:type VII secretion-associated serine protease [Streptomyces glebosus]|uniref:Type VII secretion-associated serine protease n=1 Tax=Streptomyces glebosus TaxID=249580 RepID=A0A640T5Z9_9ACTN|nr:type VII secretion-associated serine protease mycosin [Streptomyces glebosus]GFE17931.1 type VII secretion-associated serine protease [Streptomyces glebosus]GHG47029.1 type VII secretion-associated serine protease [Streptomyces glebosus]